MWIYYYYYGELLLYIGSTVDIQRRQRDHKSNLKNGKNRPFYNYLKENEITYDMLSIEIIHTNITDIKLLRIEEGILIKELKPICNKDIAGRTRKEHYDNNKSAILKQKKEYREDNKDAILKQKKEYYDNNKDEINRKDRERYHLKKQQNINHGIVKDVVEEIIDNIMNELF